MSDDLERLECIVAEGIQYLEEHVHGKTK